MMGCNGEEDQRQVIDLDIDDQSSLLDWITFYLKCILFVPDGNSDDGL